MLQFADISFRTWIKSLINDYTWPCVQRVHKILWGIRCLHLWIELSPKVEASATAFFLNSSSVALSSSSSTWQKSSTSSSSLGRSSFRFSISSLPSSFRLTAASSQKSRRAQGSCNSWTMNMSHCQMLGKFEYTLPAKFWRLVGCTEMLSW